MDTPMDTQMNPLLIGSQSYWFLVLINLIGLFLTAIILSLILCMKHIMEENRKNKDLIKLEKRLEKKLKINYNK